ncbi:MAG: hypothetical protein PHT00_01910 [Candidatus Methanomethylophilus sp.]|nr:hypothetical protein [Methanomethylophilus sp.]MDD4668491.1 hypothetical protein [Methanomethylophilus sp.]
MTDARYGKCRVCRFCVHSENDWACMIKSKLVHPGDSCERFRPGSCENCSRVKLDFDRATCTVTGAETDILSVCDHYDPDGRHSFDSQ